MVTTDAGEEGRARETGRPPSLAVSLVCVEVLSAIADAVLLGAPIVGLLGGFPDARPGDVWLSLLPAAVWLLSAGTLVTRLRPLIAAQARKRAGQPLGAASVPSLEEALARGPAGSARSRLALWVIAATGFLAYLTSVDRANAMVAAGCLGIVALHAAAVASGRAILLDRVLARAALDVLPNRDPFRVFADQYRARLARCLVAQLGATSAVLWVLASALVDLSARQASALIAPATVALLLLAVVWRVELRRRSEPVERYLDLAVRSAGGTGPPRDNPEAVAAFVVAQALPYRLALSQGLGTAAAGVAATLIAWDRIGELDGGRAGRFLALFMLVVLAASIYQALFLRDALRPLLGQLGARHRLPLAKVRSPVGIRFKLIGFFASLTAFSGGLVVLVSLAPPGEIAALLASIVVALAIALGLALLVVRDIVTPIRALEARSDEMARGELARPVPPGGEADEVGRLSFAFEEMRRALRDKLRSTESQNVDLEREVRRRTEALERRNLELNEALEKLRRAQDDLIRTEKLASMGRLVAGIAHEINNPVNAVINTLGPLDDVTRQVVEATDLRAARASGSSAREMLAVIQRGAARTKAIVQALHNYSRGGEETLKEVNIERSIDDTVHLLRHRLKNIKVEKDIADGTRIAGFAGQIDQVLMNLVTNAAQAIGDRPGIIRISARQEAQSVVLSVCDDGPGIPVEVLPRIFDPFYTTKDVGEGSGLGLSIVHGIVERHGGRIEVDSAPGRGATFRVVLPVFAGLVAAAQPG